MAYLDDSSASHHAFICREEAVSAVIEELLKPSKVMDAHECGSILPPVVGIHLIGVRLTNLKWAMMQSKRECWIQWECCQPVCVLMVAAIVVGMKKAQSMSYMTELKFWKDAPRNSILPMPR